MYAKEQLAHWMNEREWIRVVKDSGVQKPWSLDPIFQQTYFCNVNREHDKVTQHIRTWADPYRGGEHFAANMVMARFVNKPASLDQLSMWYGFDKVEFCDVMSQKGSWGSAYIVSTNGRKQPKHEYIAGLLELLFEQLQGWPSATPKGLLATAHRRLQALSGLGSFLAAQVIADLKNTLGHPLAHATDWYSFAAPGPGSLRGLEWFHGRRVTPKDFKEALVDTREWLYTSGLVDKRWLDSLCNQNLQNCMCEYDKYMRIKNNTGRSKRRYNGA